MNGPAPSTGPARVVGRVTALDSFHRWRQGVGYDAGLDTEAYVKRMCDPFYDNPAMAKGRALHKALEVAVPGDFETLTAEGITFHFDDDCELELATVRELRCGMEYGDLFVTGQVDALEGKRVEDHKSTGFFQAETYLDGYQWRFYLDIFEADVFRWNVYPLRPYRDPITNIVLPDHFAVGKIEVIEQRRYPGLHRDCAALAAEYLEFSRAFILPEQARRLAAGEEPAPPPTRTGSMPKPRAAKQKPADAGTDLATITRGLDPGALFCRPEADRMIAAVREAVIHVVPDLTTAAGRKAIAGLAYKVAQTKVAIDDIGKKHVADVKASIAAIDAERKHLRDSLDALKEEVRAPLTEWEAEQARIEAEAAEAERLAAEAVERERREREEAAERERREREEAVARKEQELAAREAAITSREQAERLAQQQLVREAQIREEAAEAERAAIERREEAERLEAARRAADVEHRRAVKAAARDGLADFCSIDRALATRIIQAIAAGKVPAVSITY